jgi:hypothetical protein
MPVAMHKQLPNMKRKNQTYVAPVNSGATIADVIRGSVPAGKLGSARINVVNQSGSAIGGCTAYDSKSGVIQSITVPGGNRAYDLTIQSHETGHATASKPPTRKRKESANQFLARNFVEDCFIEQRPLPVNTPASYTRNHLTAAMHDLRNLRNSMRKGPLPTVDARNAAIGIGCRISAMLNGYNGSLKARNAFQRTFGPLTDTLEEIAYLARHPRSRKKAIQILEALFETEPLPETESKPGKEGTDMPDANDNAAFAIVNLLPKDSFCVRERTVSMRNAPNGVVLNPNRFVAAIVEGNSNGLFSRRTRLLPGGTILIDASGSMGCTAENLKALCQTLPTSTVAYYCGNARQSRLYLYADKGKRYSGDNPRIGSGNQCDLEAIKWLERQLKPWTLISDLQFCGGPKGNAECALAKVARLQFNNQIEVINSFEEAFTRFAPKTK